MSGFFKDLRFGFRQWYRYPVSNLTAILVLALGIGANTANFSLINAFMLRPLPFAEAERLVQLFQTDPLSGIDQEQFSVPHYLELKEHSDVFEDFGAYAYQTRSVAGGDEEAERVTVSRMTSNLLSILRVAPQHGRNFLPEEETQGKHRVALVAAGFARRRFGDGARALDQTFELEGATYTIVGVMPDDFTFPFAKVKIWRPLVQDPDRYSRQSLFLLPVGRLRDGVGRAQAQTELASLFERLEQEHSGEETVARSLRVVPLRDALLFLFDLVKPLLWLGTAANGFVLLIVCANIANLLLIRSVSRGRETALRTALGATRGRLFRQFFAEGVLLALAGGLLGCGIAFFVTRLLAASIPDDLFRIGTITVDGQALAFTLVVALLATLVFSLAPTFHGRQRRLGEVLKEAGTGTAGGRRARRLHDAMVVAQVTLAVVLLVLTSLMVQSFLYMRQLSPGFDPQNLLTMELHLPSVTHPRSAITAFYRRMIQEIESLPGVTSAALVNPLPLNFEAFSRDFSIDGMETTSQNARQQARSHFISPGYFETMGIPLRDGRPFTPHDLPSTTRVFVVNETLSARYWPQEGALGQQLRPWRSDTQANLVGVVTDTKSFFMNEEGTPIIYTPQTQQPQRRTFLVIRTVPAPLTLIDSVRTRLHSLDPGLPISNIRTMEEVIGASIQPFEASALTLAALAVTALILAALGIYGVVAYAVGQSSREIGVRMALGAEAPNVLRLVLGHGAVLTGIGLAIGLALSLTLTYFVSSFLFGVTRFDPLTFIAVALVLLAISLASGYVPARRATRVDPVHALRIE